MHQNYIVELLHTIYSYECINVTNNEKI